jgi:hypothetical protein
LMARYVIPQFQDSAIPIEYSQQWTAKRSEMLFGNSVTAIMKAIQDYKQHAEEQGRKPSDVVDQPITRVRP